MFNALRNLLTNEPPPTQVTQVQISNYIQRPVLARSDGLILYGLDDKPTNLRLKYEIVLNRPFTETMDQAFSLFRTPEHDQAETKFICFKEVIPLMLDVSRDMSNIKNLQVVCDLLHTHPSWSVAHVAVQMSLVDVLKHPNVQAHLDRADGAQGVTPLHVAIKKKNREAINVLLTAKCSLDKSDSSGNTVYHYAATTSVEIIILLCKKSTSALNNRNLNGHTPLHLACLANKSDCVIELLKAGADVNKEAMAPNPDGDVHEAITPPGYVGDFLNEYSKKIYMEDIQFGGTPLHWACSREVCETLLAMGCHINALNFNKRTALHVMALRNRLECVIALLSHEADPNIADSNGDTALHLAVIQKNIPIVKALIVFGANLNYKNNLNVTPRHLCERVRDAPNNQLLYTLHAVNAVRCDKEVNGCTEGCGWEGTYNGQPPPIPIGHDNRDTLDQMLDVAANEIASKRTRLNNNKREKGSSLLCLDGGGIRGLVLVQMIIELERELNEPIMKNFDWVAGTSTGGILALGLALGKTTRQAQCLYFRLKQHAFVGTRPYDSEKFEAILKDMLGHQTKMSDVKHPKLMIMSVLADRMPVDLHIFRNYDKPLRILKASETSSFGLQPCAHDQLVWKAARATGAAPSYFRAFENYLDGALVANNPTLDALMEIHEYNLALKAVGRQQESSPLTVVVSLGCGMVPREPAPAQGIDLFRPTTVFDWAKAFTGVSSMVKILIDQATLADGRMVDRARAWCSTIGVHYYRFCPQLSQDVPMDEKNDEVLVNMLWETKVYMLSKIGSIKEVVAAIRNARSRLS